jgi:hypothetical protein
MMSTSCGSSRLARASDNRRYGPICVCSQTRVFARCAESPCSTSRYVSEAITSAGAAILA